MKKKTYEQTFKDKIIRLHLEDGRTINSLNKEYQLGSGTLNGWLRAYRKECEVNPQQSEEKHAYEEIRRLRKQLEELEKENRFLKKGSSLLRQGTRLEIYQFIQKHHTEFGVRWLLRKFNICPNAYYNFLKDRKAAYRAKK